MASACCVGCPVLLQVLSLALQAASSWFLNYVSSFGSSHLYACCVALLMLPQVLSFVLQAASSW
jgi:hypothetical protein